VSTYQPASTCPAATESPRLRRRSVGALLFAAAIVLGWATLGTHNAEATGGFTQAAALPGLGSGRIWSVAVEPSAPSTILAGTDKGV
jgi:hypothetical protein